MNMIPNGQQAFELNLCQTNCDDQEPHRITLTDQEYINAFFDRRRCPSPDVKARALEMLPAMLHIVYRNDTIRIPLTKVDKYAVIDARDFPLVMSYSWSHDQPQNVEYAKASRPNGQRDCCLFLHQLILSEWNNGYLPDGWVGDHINGDGLDNRRINLHLVPRNYNNRTKQHVPGVTQVGAQWEAQIVLDPNECNQACLQHIIAATSPCRIYNEPNIKFGNKKVLRLGRFDTEAAAYKAYRVTCRLLYGF